MMSSGLGLIRQISGSARDPAELQQELKKSARPQSRDRVPSGLAWRHANETAQRVTVGFPRERGTVVLKPEWPVTDDGDGHRGDDGVPCRSESHCSARRRSCHCTDRDRSSTPGRSSRCRAKRADNDDGLGATSTAAPRRRLVQLCSRWRPPSGCLPRCRAGQLGLMPIACQRRAPRPRRPSNT